MSCPVPENEADRMSAVRAYDILDTAPEIEFDVTTRVASHLFDLPIALVAILDQDRLWFKSKHGLDLPQIDRQIAFCAHAVAQPDDLLVVEDLTQDARFDDNPLVHGPTGIRFYAGAPLKTSAGLALGTIAVLGTEPRRFGPEQRELLRDLSVSVVTAIESRHRSQELKKLATTDALTGLNNRMQFESVLSQALLLSKRTGNQVAVLYLDLDGFKPVNDTYGHAAGDEILQQFSQRLMKLVRAHETLARLGGDEFAIAVCADATLDGLETFAERIVMGMKEPFVLSNNREVTVGVSVGIAMDDGHKTTTSRLIDQADNALFKAKSLPSQRWYVYGTTFQRPLYEPMSSFGELVVSDEGSSKCESCADGIKQPFPFTMAFQPIVSASTQTVFAYEALVRGVNQEGAAFVLDRVTRSNRYAFDQSCRKTAIELSTRLGILATGASLSINFISGAMYEPENCVRATLAAAKKANFPLSKLILEVTEGEEVFDPLHLAKIFNTYRKHGLVTAIDDFGAGYSGLNLLAEFQPQILKIDRQLLQDVDQLPAKQAILRGVLSVCKDLRITPIAEGVETVAEYAVLRTMGVDLFQGYLFAYPAFESLPVPLFPA